MPDVSFDFKRYIDERRGVDEAIARSGAAYTYPGDHKVLRTLARMTPVTLAVEATVRLWKSVAQSEVLGTAVKVTERQFPEIYRLSLECAARLRIPPPTVYVVPQVGTLNAQTLGTNEDAFIALNGVLVDHLSDEELRFVIGHECGHIQNNHVVYMTALYYLVHAANVFLRWIVTPAAVALQGWARRAEITCDRAGMLCCRDLEPAVSALTRMALGSQRLAERLDVTEYLKQLPESRQGVGRLAELFRSHPYLPKRVEALRLFARTHYFLKEAGRESEAADAPSLAWCDGQVRQLLSVFSDGKAGEEAEHGEAGDEDEPGK